MRLQESTRDDSDQQDGSSEEESQLDDDHSGSHRLDTGDSFWEQQNLPTGSRPERFVVRELEKAAAPGTNPRRVHVLQLNSARDDGQGPPATAQLSEASTLSTARANALEAPLGTIADVSGVTDWSRERRAKGNT